MKKLIFILVTFLIISCNGNDLCEEYTCQRSNGEFGSILKFKSGGKLFLDLVTNEQAERYSELRNKLDIAGEYEIIDDKIVIKYFDGYQTHTLNKTGDKLTSNTESFRLCNCKEK